MYARVVRFTGVTQETIDHVRSQIEQSDGPPPGVNAKAMKMLFDADQGTSLFIAFALTPGGGPSLSSTWVRTWSIVS